MITFVKWHKHAYQVRETCPVSQKLSRLQTVMAVDVQMSNINATAPP